MLSRIKKNKENILYAIVTAVLLETVRVKHNLLEDRGRKENWGDDNLQNERKSLINKASLLYGILVALILVNIPISLTDKITNVYPDTMFLKTNMALIIVLVVTYFASVMLTKVLLYQYIKWMNGLIGFWKKLGRSAWDGTKVVAHAPVRAGGVVIDRVIRGTKSGIDAAGRAGRYSKDKIIRGAEIVSRRFKKKEDDETN